MTSETGHVQADQPLSRTLFARPAPSGAEARTMPDIRAVSRPESAATPRPRLFALPGIVIGLGYVAAYVLLICLLAVSGVFSGAETVLFSLSRHDRARMKKSANRLEALAANLLDNPRHLLTSLLVG